MPTTHESRGGLLGFLATIPGIITACAALITAIGTVYVTNDDGSPPDPTPPVVQPTSEPPPSTSDPQPTLQPQDDDGPEPAVSPPVDEDVAAVLDVDAFTGMGVDDSVQITLEDCAAGDLVACGTVLDTLSQECYGGFWLSCDVLYEVSPIGSAYEWYGGTCGGFFADLTFAGVCSEQ